MVLAQIRGSAPPGGMGVVDVRDVAQAHIRAMLSPNAKGRYLVAADGMYWVNFFCFLFFILFSNGAR